MASVAAPVALTEPPPSPTLLKNQHYRTATTSAYDDRADDYEKYRQGFAPSTIRLLAKHFDLKPDAVVADVGAGTGIVSKLVLETLAESHPGLKVIGVEPNDDMRRVQQESLASYIASGKFTSVKGTGEVTGLEDKSVDLITVASTFHWLQPVEAAREFHRISRPSTTNNGAHTGPAVAIMQNTNWDMESLKTPEQKKFWTAYFQMYKSYVGVGAMAKSRNSKTSPEALEKFFGGEERMEKFTDETWYDADLDYLTGIMKSGSISPPSTAPYYEEFWNKFAEVFMEHAPANKKMPMCINTKMWFGNIA